MIKQHKQEKRKVLSIPRQSIFAAHVRDLILEISHLSRQGHVGCALSCVEILTVLHAGILRPVDRFILSKGHAVLALYAVLHQMGILSFRELRSFCRNGSRLYGHPDHRVPGVAVTTGSLGHGLGIAAGMAYAASLRKTGGRIYVLMSDGECNEGSVWEAAAVIGRERLPVVAVVDENGLQATDQTAVLSRGVDYPEIWRAHGWRVLYADGHELTGLNGVCKRASRKNPTVILARTVKGKGISFMENSVEWHYRRVTERDLVNARREWQCDAR